MSWFRISLLAAVLVPIAATGSRLATKPQAQTLEARVAVSVDPLSGECIPQVTLGTDVTGNPDLVLAWATLGDKFCCIDGATKDDDSPPTLPWRSSVGRTAFRIPKTVPSDLHVFAAVRLMNGAVTTNYSGDEYFVITSESREWKPRSLVLKLLNPAHDVRPMQDIESAKLALKAQLDYEKALYPLVLSGRQDRQPRFGPSSGLQVTFVQPPAPGGMQVHIDRVTIEGPTHGLEPLHVWLWVVDNNNVGTCTSVPPLSQSAAFCDYSVLPASIPVPSDLNVNSFNPANMAVPTGATDICIVGIIEERSYSPTTHIQYRYHYGESVHVPSALPAPAGQPITMSFCGSFTTRPSP